MGAFGLDQDLIKNPYADVLKEMLTILMVTQQLNKWFLQILKNKVNMFLGKVECQMAPGLPHVMVYSKLVLFLLNAKLEIY